MKLLHEFTVYKQQMVEEKVKTEDGILLKEVEKKIPIRFAIKVPSRKEREEGDMIYALRLGECIRLGLMTKAQLTKEYSEKGGVWSEKERLDYAELQDEYAKANKVLTDSQMAYVINNSELNKTKLVLAYHKATALHEDIKQFEEHKSSVFNETAEMKARNRTLLWFICNLTYTASDNKEDETNFEPFFKGNTFQEKLDYYDIILEEGEEWQLSVLDRIAMIISFWYSGQVTNSEDIVRLEEILGYSTKTGENLKEEVIKTLDKEDK